MDVLDRFVKNDHYARSLGIEVVDYGKGFANTEVEIKRNHLNSAGTAHGGLIFSLADVAFSIASNSHGQLAMAIETSISYFRSRKEGVLSAEAREVELNPKLATYLIEVRDEEKKLIALFKGTVYRKKTNLSELMAKSGNQTESEEE